MSLFFNDSLQSQRTTYYVSCDIMYLDLFSPLLVLFFFVRSMFERMRLSTARILSLYESTAWPARKRCDQLSPRTFRVRNERDWNSGKRPFINPKDSPEKLRDRASTASIPLIPQEYTSLGCPRYKFYWETQCNSVPSTVSLAFDASRWNLAASKCSARLSMKY